MEIRRVQPGDKASVLALVKEIDADDYIPYCFDDWVGDLQGVVFLAAYEDARLLGVANVQFLSERVAWLQALRVAPSQRRRGVGRALSLACLERAARAGRQVARLLIDIDNHASLSLSVKNGFYKIAEWLRLEKPTEPVAAPAMRSPQREELPQLVRLAEQWGLQLWHTDWNTYDMSVEALQVSLDNDTLRILPEQPAATMLDVVFDEEDDEYRTYNPLGEESAVKQILLAMEKEAHGRGVPRVAVLLAADSPHLSTVQQLGYKFSLVKDHRGCEIVDGVTIWEYDLTQLTN